ncbi:N-6 DNA methylase [Virgibacillus sp. C22-A2]|uniref:N-6 DNA methylase n=1 Tax=Virgibacillus tibetensis TaxID=3042313 RepID=A0ABU6KIZ2_9BACI|nr:N-6 DNA methylase [Virgibacillus sp. C22-A2]
MRTSESTQIITKFIPKLTHEARIPISNLKTDCTTNKTGNKRIDVIISNVNNQSDKFEDYILTIIEVKQESALYLDIYDEGSLEEVREEYLKLIVENVENYEQSSQNFQYGSIPEKEWFNALIQGLWKAKKLNLEFFAVTNTNRVQFYHTETLKPLYLQRTSTVIENGNFKLEDVVEQLNGLPSFSLLKDLSQSITSQNNICDYRKLNQDEQNEKVSMNEQQFIDLLGRIHNEFYKGSLSGRKKYLGDVILTFLFFKYLEERVLLSGRLHRYQDSGIPLWSEWVNYEDLTLPSKTIAIGQKIYETVKRQLELLANTEDVKDNHGEYIRNYEREYRDFSSILANINQIPDNDIGYTFLAKLYKELNGINTSTSRMENILYLHACNFDVYGSIYEKFKDKDEKEELGQFYTRRHIAKVLARLTLKPYIEKLKGKIHNYINDQTERGSKIDPNRIINIIKEDFEKMKILDPSCGTGGLLTEAYEYLVEEYTTILNGKNKEISSVLSNDAFTGIDIEEDSIKKAKLNMFFAGDGHNRLFRGSSLEKLYNQEIELSDNCDENEWNVIISNPPYGKGKEYTFMKKYIDALPYNGRIGIIIPNGILENPTKVGFRKYILKNIKIESIISLNKFVFAPYTKQKTYMLIGYKRDKIAIDELNGNFIEEQSGIITPKLKFENLSDKIWFYNLDFDGYNLSDDRWETDLVVINDDVPEYIHNDINELLNNYLKPDIIKENQLGVEGELLGVKDESGKHILRKSGYYQLNTDITESNYYNLLPEFYMRPYTPEYLTEDEFEQEVSTIWDEIKDLTTKFQSTMGEVNK